LLVAPHGPGSPVGNVVSAHVCVTIPNFHILETRTGKCLGARTSLIPPEQLSNAVSWSAINSERNNKCTVILLSVIPADDNPSGRKTLESRQSGGDICIIPTVLAHHLAELQMMRPISARPSLTIASIRVEQAFAQDFLP